MEARSKVRVWWLVATVLLFVAAVCFALLGIFDAISPVTMIGNVAGFLLTGLAVGFFALRK